MKRPVILTTPAFEDLRRNTRWWAEHRSLEQAQRWYDGFLSKLDSLEENPERCPLARENAEFTYELREVNYGVRSRPTHRAVFTIRPDSVLVMAIRHAAQSELTSADI
jgi:plasmid stabilization system protein ParE